MGCEKIRRAAQGWRALRAAGAALLLAASSVAPAAELTIAIQPRWRQATLSVPSAELTNASGQALRLTRFAALVSGVALIRDDGAVVRLDGQYGFIDAERGRLAVTLRNVPAATYRALEFQIGLPAETNHADPSQWPAGHPLNPLVNALHWSWQGGYVFAALEGKWREPAGSGKVASSPNVASAAEAGDERGFVYHLANDAHLMRASFRADFEIKAATRVDLALDLSRVLGAQRFAAGDGSESTHSAPGDVLAAKLAAAMERAWFWLGAEEVARDEEVGRGVPAEPSSATDENSPKRLGGDASPYQVRAGTTPFAFTVPPGFPQPSLPADNPLTHEAIALGAVLFSEARLSGNGTQSCASCHAPGRAFSDSVALSRGADGTRGKRNAMPLFNLAWSPSYAWDGSQPRIRDQARAAWTNPIEMHGDPEKVAAALPRDAALADKFAAAFGSREVTPERITLALEQFLLAQVSADSKFDRAARGEAQLTDEEKRGFELFMTEYDPGRGRFGADCFHCHGGALFTDFGFKNTGVERFSGDAGRALVTQSRADRGKFKTPSLRNVALTAPYGHDGRFATLEDVIAHYDHGVKRSPNLDPNLAKHGPDGLQLSAADQRALVAFLRTLTDLGNRSL